jgi:hypothetical protein
MPSWGRPLTLFPSSPLFTQVRIRFILRSSVEPRYNAYEHPGGGSAVSEYDPDFFITGSVCPHLYRVINEA